MDERGFEKGGWVLKNLLGFCCGLGSFAYRLTPTVLYRASVSVSGQIYLISPTH
jgi:hypothetical protein